MQKNFSRYGSDTLASAWSVVCLFELGFIEALGINMHLCKYIVPISHQSEQRRNSFESQETEEPNRYIEYGYPFPFNMIQGE